MGYSRLPNKKQKSRLKVIPRYFVMASLALIAWFIFMLPVSSVGSGKIDFPSKSGQSSEEKKTTITIDLGKPYGVNRRPTRVTTRRSDGSSETSEVGITPYGNVYTEKITKEPVYYDPHFYPTSRRPSYIEDCQRVEEGWFCCELEGRFVEMQDGVMCQDYERIREIEINRPRTTGTE